MHKIIGLMLCLTCTLSAFAFTESDTVGNTVKIVSLDQNDTAKSSKSRLTIGGYGEAVYKYNFFSDNMFRYSHAERYAQSKGHGRVDLPHAVFMVGYDFGHGWSFNAEVEFEHGGIESAVEVEDEETGEFEKELERGGEVALEQFWLQKSLWNGKMNIRAGHIVVPVGATNNAHLPTDFFGVYRPEGENTILPCTWHETGIEIWGRVQNWRYDVMLIPALNSSMFDVSSWANNSSASGYEFRVANKLAVAARVDFAAKGWQVGVSGYVGNTFQNDIITDEYSNRYKDVKGTCVIGSFDIRYKHNGFITRGNVDYGYLADASLISGYNASLSNSSQSPYPHTLVGKAAWCVNREVGYDVLYRVPPKKADAPKRSLFVFARYEYYDSYIAAEAMTDYAWTNRHCVSGGINYRPIPQIVIKAEAGVRLLKKQYNNEPWMALGITWAGMFQR